MPLRKTMIPYPSRRRCGDVDGWLLKKQTMVYNYLSMPCFVIKRVNKHDDVIKCKRFPRYWSFLRGIHRFLVNSPHKGQWRGTLMFSLICARINCWVNNREAGDLRRHRTHCDVIVMRCPDTNLMSCCTQYLEVSFCHCSKMLSTTLKWSPNVTVCCKRGSTELLRRESQLFLQNKLYIGTV